MSDKNTDSRNDLRNLNLTNEDDLDTSEAVGTAGGVVAGAVAGSLFGPLGTVAGAVAGGVLGNKMGENGKYDEDE